MDWVLLGKLIVIFLLVAGNAFFVSAEIALTSARRSRIKQLAGMGNRSAQIVRLLHKEPERFYSVTQIGITLVSLALGAIGMVTITEIIDPSFEKAFMVFGDSKEVVGWAHTVAYVVAFLVISFMHVVGGELAPKVYAFHKAESLSMSVSRVIDWLYRVMRPLIWVMNHASKKLLWVFGQGDLVGQNEGHFSMTGDEIRTVLSASEQEGVLDPQLTMMLRGVFDLDEHTSRDAMVPRTEVLALSKKATVGDALTLFNQERRARYPVYDKSLDNIVGVVVMKEMLNNLATDANIHFEHPVTDIMMDPYFIPDSIPLSTLLKQFTGNRRQMAIVLDEYGGTAGIITLEDLLEEIVGDYEDEFTPRHRHIKKVGKGRYVVAGGVRVTELEPKLNFPFPSGDYVTLGGLMSRRLGAILDVGDKVELEGGRLTVLEMDVHRVTKVLFQDLVVENGSVLESATLPPAEQGAGEQAEQLSEEDKATEPAATRPAVVEPAQAEKTNGRLEHKPGKPNLGVGVESAASPEAKQPNHTS